MTAHPTMPLPELGLPTLPEVDHACERVIGVFNRQLAPDFPLAQQLCRHIEQYRGKMLRPKLVLLSALASVGRGAGIDDEHITVAAVLELIHIATLVHDDVLDDAETRRGARTVNRLHGVEAAVIFGDYLISQSFHLCSSLDDQSTALRVGEITSTVCAGELLQLANRGNNGLDEGTYFTIIERKTAALIALACELGAKHAGASPEATEALRDYGLHLGVAFQIQDDLLDLVGDEPVVGKSLGKDLQKGKLTLPLIHHLREAGGEEQQDLLYHVRHDVPLNGSRRWIVDRLEQTGSIGYARAAAADRIARAKAGLDVLPPGPAADHLRMLADAVITRDH
jgi:octaprenyl-diphosphate synthase